MLVARRMLLLLLLLALSITVGLHAPGLPSPAAAETPPAATALPSLGQGLELVGQVGGTMQAVAVQGTLVFAGIGPRLAAFDGTAPETPRMLGRSAPLHGVVSDVAVAGGYAYVVTQNASLHILDITDPAHLRAVGAVAVGGDARSIAVAGGVAYVAAGDAGLRVFDVRDPARPLPAGALTTPAPASDVAVRGQHAYVAAGRGGVRIVDVAQPAHPVEAGSLALTGNAVHVDARGQWLYVVDSGHLSPEYRSTGDARLVIFDAGDAARPVRAGEHRTGGGAEGLAVDGTLAYVAVSWWNDAGLRIINVADPANPVRAGNFPIRWNQPLDVAVSGGVVYVAEASGTLRTIAVSDPSAPAEAGSFAGGGAVRYVAVAGDRAYVVDEQGSVRIFSTATPGEEQQIGQLTLPGSDQGIVPHVAIADRTAYVTTDAGLHIVNVAGPAHPVVRGFLELPNAQAVAVAGQHAYVSDGSLRVVSIADPAAPAIVGTYAEPPASIADVVVRGQYAYVVDLFSGLRILDVSDPSRPSRAGWASFNGGRAVALHGDYALVADVGYRTLTSGLHIVPVAPLANADAAQQFREMPGRTFGVSVQDGRAYVAAYDAGVRALDLSDPLHPAEIGYFNTPGGAAGVTAANGLVYAYGSGGLMVLRPAVTAPPPTPVAPAPGSTLPAIAAELVWQNPPGTAQVEVRVLPYRNDGPGLDLILGAPRERLRMDGPVMGQGPYLLLPDMGYAWTVRSSTATQPLGVDSPAWGPWSPPQTFRTPPVTAEGLAPVMPEPGAAGLGRTPTVQWRDARSDVFYYEVQMSRDPRFETHPVRGTVPVYWNLVHGGETRPLNSWTVPAGSALEPGMTYYWRVRPRVQGDGTPVAWSPAWNFTVAP